MAGPLGGDVKDPGASTTNIKTSTTSPLGGVFGDSGASTINVKNIDGGPLGPHGWGAV
jgi:hypothetical protein